GGAAGASAGGAPPAIMPPHSMQKRGVVGGSAAPQWRQKRGGGGRGWDAVIARWGSFGGRCGPAPRGGAETQRLYHAIDVGDTNSGCCVSSVRSAGWQWVKVSGGICHTSNSSLLFTWSQT